MMKTIILITLLITSQVYGKNTADSYCNGKLVINRIEKVQLENSPTLVPAKIDTGADMSSLSATNVQYVKRMNDPWVLFFVILPDSKPLLFYKPLIRFTTVKNTCITNYVQSRPVVELMIKIAGHQYTTLVNLTNRSDLKYPMLIGVNTIRQMNAIVDINNELDSKPKK